MSGESLMIMGIFGFFLIFKRKIQKIALLLKRNV